MLKMEFQGITFPDVTMAETKKATLPPNHKNQRKKRSPTKGKRASKPTSIDFGRTPLGRYLLHRCPLEYRLIRDSIASRRIPVNLVEAVAYASDNPAFKTVEFRKALIDFRKYGLRTPNAVQFDVDAEIKLILAKLGVE